MKHIWFGIVIITMHTAFGENFNDKETVSGELRLTLEEQSPSAILEKCANVPNEPLLTPLGVVNPFAECVKGNSEMHNYVSIEDQQKPSISEDSSVIKEEIQEAKETFDPNSADPTESADELRADEMKEFLEMVENDNQNQPTL